MTEDDVKKLINQITVWLDEELKDYTEQFGTRSPKEEFIRDMCYELLDAAKVNSRGGCPLCCL